MQQLPVTACETCGYPLSNGQLICPNCRSLVFRRRLEQLAFEASQLEFNDPTAAALRWRQALELLPPDAPQYQQIQYRVAALDAGWRPGHPVQPTPAGRAAYPAGVRPPDPLPLAVAKTLGSMLLAAAVYYAFLFHNWVIALGFVVLMLVHEMGHVIAMWYFGLSASPPIFIPFIGALINMRQSPPNALVESIVGMGGPFLGTIGAFACYAAAMAVHNPVLHFELLASAQLAFMLNLFNLLPVPPLDGGRITAAVSPWLWIPGLVGLVALMIVQSLSPGGGFGLFVLIMVLLYALPRIRMTLRRQGMDTPYYRVSRAASWAMGALYFGLGAGLSYMFFIVMHGFNFFRGG
jgi:Zn-dependent protease